MRPRLDSSKFQFLSRNSSRSRMTMRKIARDFIACFNSSVGILLVHAFDSLWLSARMPSFQFLSRNSSRSRQRSRNATQRNRAVSIPQSEFFSFTPPTRCGTIHRNLLVSIPQSEFFSFTPGWRIEIQRNGNGFNSSVGILLVHAQSRMAQTPRRARFQFLSRNSSRSRFFMVVDTKFVNSKFQFLSRNSSRSRQAPGRSLRRAFAGFNSSVGILLVHAANAADALYTAAAVSIPQSEFFSFTPSRARRSAEEIRVSIPQSEFFSFTPQMPPMRCTPRRRFQFLSRNSSRSRQAALEEVRKKYGFQFLSRNSSRSRFIVPGSGSGDRPVSIPQSEFFSFTQTGDGK